MSSWASAIQIRVLTIPDQYARAAVGIIEVRTATGSYNCSLRRQTSRCYLLRVIPTAHGCTHQEVRDHDGSRLDLPLAAQLFGKRRAGCFGPTMVVGDCAGSVDLHGVHSGVLWPLASA